METAESYEASMTESFQDAAISEKYETFKTGLIRQITAGRNAYRVSSAGEPDRFPDFISTIHETVMEPSRIHRMAMFVAEQQYLSKVHEQYFTGTVEEPSNKEHLDAISSPLADRKALCGVCFSVVEQISTFLLAFDSASGETPRVDAFWPPRQSKMEETSTFLHSLQVPNTGDEDAKISGPLPTLPRDRDAYIREHRFIPPEGFEQGGTLPSNVIQHHQSAGDLFTIAKSCPLCELLRLACILDSFRQRGSDFDHSMEPLANILASIRRGRGSTLFNRILRQLRSSEDPLFLMLWNVPNSPRLGPKSTPAVKLNHIRLIWKRPITDIADYERQCVYTRLQVFHSKTLAPDLASFISPHQPLQSSESQEAFQLLRNWLCSCQNQHSKCMKTISGEIINEKELHKLPRRLINVGAAGSDNELCLIETTGLPNGQWVALSHCWGEPENHPLKTTRETLGGHMKGIPLSSIPKTFVDAIIVTRALGLRYIWIDSLCIIQDDEDDWLAESQKMGMIYERAVLTIAASSAVNSTQGLFIQRPYYNLQAPSVQLPFFRKGTSGHDTESLQHYSIGIQWQQEPFMKELDPMDTALFKRGWATQELILSRRTVHFLDRGMVWVCNSMAEDETGYLIIGRDLACGDWSTKWAQIVQDHSNRQFTYQKDRLISLQGLATQYAKLKPISRFYAFGLFDSDLPAHLLWSPKKFGKKLKDLPSWSWASCPYEIYFRFRDHASIKDCAIFLSTCKILGFGAETSTLNVRAKRTEIQQHLVTKFDSEDEYTNLRHRANEWHPICTGYYISLPDQDPKGWAIFDNGRELVDPSQRVFFLQLAFVALETEPRRELYGILLVKDSSGRDGYVRVGVAAISDVVFMLEMADEPQIEVAIF